MKQMDVDINKLIKYLCDSQNRQERGGMRGVNADVDLSILHQESSQLHNIEDQQAMSRNHQHHRRRTSSDDGIKLPNQEIERSSNGNRSSIMRTPDSSEIIG